MCKLTPDIMAQAFSAVDSMDLQQKERLANFTRPNMLVSVLVHSRMGSTTGRIDGGMCCSSPIRPPTPNLDYG